MSTSLDGSRVREAIRAAFPDAITESQTQDISPSFMYLPQSHAQALDPDVSIVSGIRGAGKTFWWRALSEEAFRNVLSDTFGLKQYATMDVRQGFGALPRDVYPNKDTINLLVAQGGKPEHVWRAIILSVLKNDTPKTAADWKSRADAVSVDPQLFDRRMRDFDARFGAEGRKVLIVFDALDRLADTWTDIRPIASALFRVSLDIRSYVNIRPKLFVRPDMLEDPGIVSFPDASKLLARKLDLLWRKTDLYALVFQRLGNVPAFGDEIRSFCASEFDMVWKQNSQTSAWMVPDKLRYEEGAQSRLFAEIAGPKMARGESGNKRGVPYSWLVNHLIDGREQVSPRSVFSALKTAADQRPMDDWDYPVDPKALSIGVSGASENRRNEIIEDYPWVNDSLKPLGEVGLTVPCEYGDLIGIWQPKHLIESLGQQSGNDMKLPPRRLDKGEDGLIDDLVELGVFSKLDDGRIQMPDIFRIGFGIKRKGGVKPLRR
jgi:hypothetical protein